MYPNILKKLGTHDHHRERICYMQYLYPWSSLQGQRSNFRTESFV